MRITTADLMIAEGTSTLFDAAARTPVLMVPGTIDETWLEGTWLVTREAGVVRWIEQVTVERMTDAPREPLPPEAAPAGAAQLHALVGAEGRGTAVETVLRAIDERVPA